MSIFSCLVSGLLTIIKNVNAKGILDHNVLNTLGRFDFFKQDKCLIFMFDEWAKEEIDAVQDSIDNVGFIFPEKNTMAPPPDMFCQVNILKDWQKLEKAKSLCKFKLKTKCISILMYNSDKNDIIEITSNETGSPNLSISVILIKSKLPESAFATFSLWYPKCGHYFYNLFILNGASITENKVMK